MKNKQTFFTIAVAIPIVMAIINCTLNNIPK